MPKSEPHATHREVELLDTLRNAGGSARNATLAEALRVSEETVRRTVKALAKAGLVQRVHGGVYLTNSEALTPVVSRLDKRSEEKSRIAVRAARLIGDGACVFLDVGSTTAYVAEALTRHRNLTVVTNGLHAAQTLANTRDNAVHLAGGALQMVEGGTFGPETLAQIQRFNIETAVFSIDGFDLRTGFLVAGRAEADLARSVAARARHTVVVADHAKFGQTAPMIACEPHDVDTVVADKPLPDAFADRLAEWEVRIVIANKHTGG